MKRVLTRKRSNTAVDQPAAKKQKTFSTRDIPWSEQRTLGRDFVEVGEGYWPVQRIIDERGKGSNKEYLIEWQSHPLTEEEFEPEWRSHVNVSDQLIRAYRNQRKNQTPLHKDQPLPPVNVRTRRSRPIIPSSSEDIDQYPPDPTDASLSPPSLGRSDSPASAIEIAESQYPVPAESVVVQLPPLPEDTADYETLQTSQFSPSNVDITLSSPLLKTATSSYQPTRSSGKVSTSLSKSSRNVNSQPSEVTPDHSVTANLGLPKSRSLINSSSSKKRPRSGTSASPVQRNGRVRSPTSRSLPSVLHTSSQNGGPVLNSDPSYVSPSLASSRPNLHLESPFLPDRQPVNSPERSDFSSPLGEAIQPQRLESRRSKRLTNNSVSANSRKQTLRTRAQELEPISTPPASVELEALQVMATPASAPVTEVQNASNEPVSLTISPPPPSKAELSGNEVLSPVNHEDTPLISGQIDPSMTIHESIEEEPPSSADTSQLLDSRLNSSQESLNNERQVETVDGIMIPTHPIFGQNEYAIPLPAEGKTKSAYEEIIKLKKRSIIKFIQRKGSPGSSEISSKKTIERNEMQEMLSRLNDTVTHSDIGLEPQSQYSLNSQGNASYAEYAGSKFVMLGYLVDRLKGNNCSIAIFTRPGELLNLVSAYLKMKGVVVRHHHRKLNDEDRQNYETGSEFAVDLLATQSGEEMSLIQRPRLIVAFDVSFATTDSQLKEIYKQYGQSIPIIHFLVTNSSEHVERCVPETLTSNIRLKVVVRTTFLAAANLGGDITYVPDESDRPADGRNMDMGDLQRAVRKSPARRLALIANILSEAALDTDFRAKWTFEGMPELKLADFDTPPRTSRAVSRTPRTPRAGTPLSRAATPIGRKRLLDVEGENGIKRQRLTPVRDGVSEGRLAFSASEELIESRKQTSDLISQLATTRAALAAAEQKESSAQRKATEWEESLGSLQSRFEKRSAETKKLHKENTALTKQISDLMERDGKRLNEKTELQRQVTELKSDLTTARNDLKAAGGDVSALEEAREAARTATTKLASLEKTLANTKSDLEFTRERYQDASKSAADSASQIKDLEAEIEKLKLSANDGKRSLKAMNYETSLQKAFARAEQFKLEVKNREAFIKKLQEENASLKSRRGVQTRGSSAQPAGSPAPRSRQASPAPAHLMPHSGSRASVLRNERRAIDAAKDAIVFLFTTATEAIMPIFSRTLVVALTALAGLASAAPKCRPSSNQPSQVPWNQPSGSGSLLNGAGGPDTICYTALGTSTVPWASSTQWTTRYQSCTSTSTSTVTTTVTTSPTSITSTVTATVTTVTTAPTSVRSSTVTTTTTLTTDITSVTTTTQTVTTTTTSTSTSTVPAPSGFQPVQSSDPGTTYSGSAGGSPVAKRAGFGGQMVGFSPNMVPQGVTCDKWQSSNCSVSTTTITTTVQGTSTGTIISTSTSTVTSTVVPSATVTTTTTSTSTQTSVISSTTVTTTTSTSTVPASTTVYAACATNNFADTKNGNQIDGTSTSLSGKQTDSPPANNAYECCVAALLDTNPAQIWFFNVNAGKNVCQIYYTTQCAAQSDNQYGIDEAPDLAVTLGNAPCGEFTT